MKALKRALIGCLFLLSLVGSVAAGELPSASPEDVGMSAAKLKQAKEAVQALVDKKQLAGAVWVVARRGKVVQLEAVGAMDADSGKPMKPDAIFRIYSMSKPITTVAAMILWEEGRFKLDDPVALYLPEFKNLRVQEGKGDETVPAKPPMTVRDLMRHTSGLTYGFSSDTPVDKLYRDRKVLDAGGTLQDMVEKLGKIPLRYQPGTRFNYSVSVDVLGRLVEVVSGKPLDVFFEERIFKPLDMKDSGFFVPEDQVERFTAVHGAGTKGGGLKVTETAAKSRYLHKPKLLSGGGGLVSTARDYLRFCQMMLNGGELDGKRLLRKETVKSMSRNQLPKEAQTPGFGFGLGFAVDAQGEYSWGGAASTHFWIAPRPELTVVALEQYMPNRQLLKVTLKPLISQAVADKPTPSKE
jgi:CubicO group peptidase (beta-lactamase class C family)